jgi:hypothetical protein
MSVFMIATFFATLGRSAVFRSGLGEQGDYQVGIPLMSQLHPVQTARELEKAA